jgi:hypothetical protein
MTLEDVFLRLTRHEEGMDEHSGRDQPREAHA